MNKLVAYRDAIALVIGAVGLTLFALYGPIGPAIGFYASFNVSYMVSRFNFLNKFVDWIHK